MSEIAIIVDGDDVIEVDISVPDSVIIVVSEVGLPGPTGPTGPAGGEITANDIEVTDYTKGIILRTLTGARVRMTFDEDITTGEVFPKFEKLT